MKYYVYEYQSGKHIDKSYPCVVLTTDPWDDHFFAETLFHARYYPYEKEAIHLGDIKIMTTKGGVTKTHIDKEFEALDETFCSLGQTLDYYEKISKLPYSTQHELLNGLRDAATNNEISNMFKDKRIFRHSLLRFSEAEKAFKEANQYFGGNITKTVKFEFHYQINGATIPHVVSLDFTKDELPYRINAFVGKNATGKTRVLTELASHLSGIKLNNASFRPERPSFSKVISISYSAFDELYKPFEDGRLQREEGKSERNEDSKLFSYKYCGLRNKDGVLSLDDLEKQFFESYHEVIQRDRLTEWNSIMKNVFEEEHIKLIESIQDSKTEKELSSSLSSGQNILLSIITDVIAHIEDDSLLLFDEPEIHLHPNAIANFMRMFYEVLHQFNSYAVISTHSPIIIQEIPSKYIKVFSRIDNTPIIDSPTLECFGENISTITNDIFEVREHENNYKTYLKSLSTKYSKEEIISLFNDDLSFNTLTYLNSLYKRGGKE
ncbi:AAA family ATPase [Oceanobacillus sp. FSL K6-0127]|uniref:AAA family ATPase n=1 Tax=Oceanobacillus sp. FSL K6-0127 TaxID=2921420 RepID=UPI0030EF0C0C